MANLYEMWTGAQANGRERVKRSQLAGLVNPAIGGDKAAQSRMMGLDPEMGMKVQGFADTRAKGQQDAQAATQKRLGGLAAGVVQAAQGGDPASVQGAYQALLQEARANNPEAQLPDAFDPADLQEIHKLVALGGGSAQGEQYTLAPGAARWEGNRKIAEQPFAPVKPDYQLYDGADGPAWLPKPTGAPQAPVAGPSGGAANVLSGALNSSMPTPETFAGIASEFPGVQLTSTKRTPEHNARVGGVPNSQHLDGTAGDYVVPDAQKPAFMAAMRAKGLHPIDEGDHVHVQAQRRAPQAGGVGAIPISGVRPKPPKQSVPSGYRLLPDGTMQAIPGGPGQVAADARKDAAAAKQTALEIKAAGKAREDSARQMEANSATDQLITAIDSLTGHAGFPELGTAYGDMKIKVPLVRSDVKDAQAQLQNIGGQVALSTMARLKALSSSGATGFGALSAPELKLLENAIATLQSDQISNVQLKASLKVIKDKLTQTKNWKPEAAKPPSGGDLSPEEQQELDQLRTQLGRK